MDYSSDVRIDLHIHSTASDGSLAPAEILAIARKINLGAIAITDHDSIDGAFEADRIGIPSPVQFLTGVEISAAPPTGSSLSGSLHILGYGIDLEDENLNLHLRQLQQARKNRNPSIIERLQQLGFAITLDEVNTEAAGGQMGRPHIAQVMVKKGYVRSINEAFNRYLSLGKPAYVDKFRIPCWKAIEIIRNSGGVSVLAHPYLLKVEHRDELVGLVRELKEGGLEGLEVYYPEHPREETEFYAELARRHHLLMTGGTDFHGAITPGIRMGSGKGDLFVPFKLYEDLVSRVEQVRSIRHKGL